MSEMNSTDSLQVMPLITDEQLKQALLESEGKKKNGLPKFLCELQDSDRTSAKAQNTADRLVLEAREKEWGKQAEDLVAAKSIIFAQATDKVLKEARHEWADRLEQNNVISLVPGQSKNLGLMITAEKYQAIIAQLREK